MSQSASFGGFRRAMANRDYAIFTVGNFICMAGDWLQRVAVGWLTWKLTGSATWLGIIAFADLAPSMIIAPLAGAYADRFDRIRFTRVTNNFALIEAVALAALFYLGVLDIWILLALTLYLGIVNALGQPSRLALVPSLLPPEDVVPAIAINSIIFNIARFAGPAAAGVIIANADVGLAFIVNAFAVLGFSISLSALRTKQDIPTRPRESKVIDEIKEGLFYVIAHPGIGPAMLLLIVSSTLSRPIIDLFPGFAAQVFGRGPEALAAMTSTIGLGALAGAVWLVMRPSIKGLTAFAINFVVVVALGLLAFTATDNFFLAIPFLFITGAGFSISASGVLTLVQSAVAPDMRGRVMSLYGIIFRGGPAFGALVMGWFASMLGFRLPVAAASVICIVMWMLSLRRLRVMSRSLETTPSPEPSLDPPSAPR
ncbi:MAG: MFS transporter [Alphaproteobacteria bacterium]